MHLIFTNKIEDEALYAGLLEFVGPEGSNDPLNRDHPFWGVGDKLLHGEAVDRFPATAFTAAKRPPDLVAFGGHYIVSANVRRVIESLNAEAGFYPVKIHQTDVTDVAHDYFVLSFLRQSVDCVDLEKSEGTWIKDRLKGERVDRLKDPTSLVLKTGALEGIQLCTVDRTHFRHVLKIASLELACALDAAKLTGMWFFTAEEYRYPDYVKIGSGLMDKQPLDCSALGF